MRVDQQSNEHLVGGSCEEKRRASQRASNIFRDEHRQWIRRAAKERIREGMLCPGKKARKRVGVPSRGETETVAVGGGGTVADDGPRS